MSKRSEEEQIAALTTTEKVIVTVGAVLCVIGTLLAKFAGPISWNIAGLALILIFGIPVWLMLKTRR